MLFNTIIFWQKAIKKMFIQRRDTLAKTTDTAYCFTYRKLFCLSILLSSTSVQALNVDDARFLLDRTGFGASPAEIKQLLPLNRTQAVDHILDNLQHKPISKPPAFINWPLPDYNYVMNHHLTGRKAETFWFAREREMAQLRVWWIDQMISTPSPLTERLVLFWHNHFVSTYKGTYLTKPLYDQLQLFRSAGTTNFATLLHAIVRDPAMLIYLNNDLNTKHHSNENLARELLELFTMGVGHYTQHDIRAFSNILAGHTVNHKTWHYEYNPQIAYSGTEDFLGVKGHLSVNDAINIILKNPNTARFISAKFYREFINLTPNPQVSDQFAKVLRENHYDLKPFLRSIFLSKAFWAQQNRGALVKSPVDLVVGFIRTFGVRSSDLQVFNSYIRLLGQNLFGQANVSGWKGGLDWISPQQLVSRGQVIRRLWDAYTQAQQAQHFKKGDLLVRLSGEYQGKERPSFSIFINHRLVKRGQITDPINTVIEGNAAVPTRPKPMWKTVDIHRDQLPQKIHSITFHFDKKPYSVSCKPSSAPHSIKMVSQHHMGQSAAKLPHQPDVKTSQPQCKAFPDNAIFVNWIQIDNKRYPSAFGQQHFDPNTGDSCQDKAVPAGMLYCAGSIHFNLQQMDSIYAGIPNTIADIKDPRGRLNRIIERGSTRVPLVMRPANRPKAEPIDFKTEFQNLHSSASVVKLLLPRAPLHPISTMGINDPIGPHAWMAMVRMTTLDPVYNLK